ncbi:MAG: pilus assembly protein [Burkholderiaceae bacterium]|nr:pilus assembly protein [Burkholderiaceae bacterium]
MMICPDSGCAHVDNSYRQHGVYAVEFALTFLIFFLVLYAVLTYGMIFAAQQTLNWAAQDGARAGLRWLPTSEGRAQAAEGVALDKASWLMNMGGSGAVQVGSCLEEVTTNPPCKPSGSGELKVVAHYNYHGFPLVPMLGPGGLIGALVPATLQAEASVHLGVSTGERLQ